MKTLQINRILFFIIRDRSVIVYEINVPFVRASAVTAVQVLNAHYCVCSNNCKNYARMI